MRIIRTTDTTVVFRRPFALSGLDRQQPAGAYRLVIDEEEIVGVSFLAYRRMATMLHTPSITDRGGLHEVFIIDPMELETALAADSRS